MDESHGHHILIRSAWTSGTLVPQPMQLEQQYADAISTAWWSCIVHGKLMMRCMCRAAFAGDTEKLLKLLEDMAPEKRTALDTHGNTVSLHAHSASMPHSCSHSVLAKHVTPCKAVRAHNAVLLQEQNTLVARRCCTLQCCGRTWGL